MRLREDDQIEVCDGRGTVARCSIVNISNRVSCSVEKKNFLAFSGVQWKLCVASGSIKGPTGVLAMLLKGGRGLRSGGTCNLSTGNLDLG